MIFNVEVNAQQRKTFSRCKGGRFDHHRWHIVAGCNIIVKQYHNNEHRYVKIIGEVWH